MMEYKWTFKSNKCFILGNGPSLGDIDLNSVKDRSLAYTPVPGGVGPMTINTLILHTVLACEKVI